MTIERPPHTTYTAADSAAERIHRHFVSHPIPCCEPAGTVPDVATLAALLDAAFWTSLRREETYTPKISFAYASPAQVSYPMSFSTPIVLAPKNLTKLAAAVERAGLHLCVWPSAADGDSLQVWGIARNLPPLCLVLEIIVPGLLVVKRSPLNDSGKFLNIAVLQGDQVKIIDYPKEETEGPELLTSLLGLETQFASGASVNVLLQIAVSMRAHGRGGMLLVVPDGGSEEWKESILHPITYLVTPPFAVLGKLIKKTAAGADTDKTPQQYRFEEAMSKAVDGIAGLTAVDGATVINSRYDLLAFGAKIVRRRGSPPVASVVVSEPVEGGTPTVAEPVDLGGTRHLAAAQFVHDQRDAIALVASQDGRFTVFGWSAGEVHGHRIDVLLM
jgi:hypothetical protein